MNIKLELKVLINCFREQIRYNVKISYRSRKEQVILDRLRIGHTRLTNSFLLKGEPPPECITCECQLTIQHILVDCIAYDFIRPELFDNNTTLKDIFGNVSSDDIVMFIKRAHLFNKL